MTDYDAYLRFQYGPDIDGENYHRCADTMCDGHALEGQRCEE